MAPLFQALSKIHSSPVSFQRRVPKRPCSDVCSGSRSRQPAAALLERSGVTLRPPFRKDAKGWSHRAELGIDPVWAKHNERIVVTPHMQFLATSLLVLSAFITAQQAAPRVSPSNRNQQHSQADDKNVSSMPAQAPPICAPSETNIQVKAPSPEQKASRWVDWFWPPEWANWALVIVAIWTACIAVGTLKQIALETKHSGDLAGAAKDIARTALESATAATRSANHAERATKLTQRADVLLKDFDVRVHSDNEVIGQNTQFFVNIRNFGPTRANDVRFDFGMTVSGNRNPVRNSPYIEPPKVTIVMGSGDEKNVAFNKLGDVFSSEIITKIADGSSELRIIGRITYKDVFGESHSVECGGRYSALLGTIVADETKIS